MSGRWTARGGWTIEAIALDDRECFRVTHRGFLVHNNGRGYCHSIEDLARVLAMYGVGLGDLVEDDPECE